MPSGLVLYGINNIYTLHTPAGNVRCVIKGKILDTGARAYNPLAPGDTVEYEQDPIEPEFGSIVKRLDRRNEFKRWNRKRKSDQTIAANVDLIICVASPESPPFRPRFIDRVVVTAEVAEIPILILLNKTDQGVGDDVRNRMEDYRANGYEIAYCSAKTGEGIAAIDLRIENDRTVFVGQSGTGKSSIINSLVPDANLHIGEISKKHNRGRHTTIVAAMLRYGSNEKGNTREIIDTPGIRDIHVAGVDAENLHFAFPEMANLAGDCELNTCSHTHEPNCAVIDSLVNGSINSDRYESYIRIYDELLEREKTERDKKSYEYE